MIEQLTADKLKLTEELSESNDQTIKATEIRVIAEGEATRLKSIIKAIEMDKQMLHQQVQKLTDLVEYFDKTTTQSVDDFIHRLKLDLNLFAEG